MARGCGGRSGDFSAQMVARLTEVRNGTGDASRQTYLPMRLMFPPPRTPENMQNPRELKPLGFRLRERDGWEFRVDPWRIIPEPER